MNRALKIALVAPFGVNIKGTTRARVIPLGQALARRSHRVAVFIPSYDDPVEAGVRRSFSGIDIISVKLPPLTGDRPGLGHVVLGLRLANAVLGWDPDVVHIFKPKGPAGIAGALIWPRRERCALVVDSDDWEGAGGWNDDPRAEYSPLARRVFAWQERFGLSHADAWTVTSDCLRSRAIGFGADAMRVVHLPNGVTTGALPTTVTRHSEPHSVLLYTRFAGVQAADIAEVWLRLRELIPDAQLTVIGRGLAAEEEELACMAGVTSVGWISPAELPGWSARSTVAILPWADTPANRARHSVKLLELMAAGSPIVAFAVGEVPATLDDAGMLVAPGDHAGFAAAVAAVIHDPALQARMGEAARARIARFTWDVLVDRALEAYELALGWQDREKGETHR